MDSKPSDIQQPHYRHDPIVEAVLELQVSPITKPVAELEHVHEGEDARYPNVQNRLMVENRIEVTEGAVSAQIGQDHIGFVYTSTNGLQTFHATTTNFIFSRLKPYDNWATFIEEAGRLWSKYCQVAEPVAITRVGVRFINQIVVPSGQIEVQDYVRTYPQLAPRLPQLMSGYFMQVTVPLEQFDAMTNISSTIAKGSEEQIAILLDIDCYRQEFVALGDSVYNLQTSEILENLHNAKNFTFEASITDATRGLIR